jgi:ubiquitin-protein ligase
MAKIKIKGSFSDLKPALSSLKSLMESQEDEKPRKVDVEKLMEKDLENIRRNGFSDNR